MKYKFTMLFLKLPSLGNMFLKDSIFIQLI